MAKLYNLTRMTTATTGTGTITLGAAVSGYLTFAQAGVASGDIVDYAIKDGNNSEIGTGTYTSSGTTLTRSVTKSTNSNAAINLSGTAEVFITPRAETLADASLLTSGTVGTARLGSGTASSATALFGDSSWKTLATIAQSGSASDLSSGTVPIARLSALPFTGGYDSGATITVGSAAVGVFSHGLGALPKIVQVYLQCFVAEQGYSVGEQVIPNPSTTFAVGGGANFGMAVVPDATNVTVRLGANATPMIICRKDNGVLFVATNANWKFGVRAYA